MLAEYAAALRKLKDARPPKDVADDVAQQLERLVGQALHRRHALGAAAHLPRYLKAIAAAARQAACRPGARRARASPSCGRSSSATCGSSPSGAARAIARLDEFRWWLEELRVSLFAQELRTPQPVSVKRLEKIWAQAFA